MENKFDKAWRQLEAIDFLLDENPHCIFLLQTAEQNSFPNAEKELEKILDPFGLTPTKILFEPDRNVPKGPRPMHRKRCEIKDQYMGDYITDCDCWEDPFYGMDIFTISRMISKSVGASDSFNNRPFGGRGSNATQNFHNSQIKIRTDYYEETGKDLGHGKEKTQ